MLERISENEMFLTIVCFRVEATFQALGKLNTYNVRIWGLEHTYVTIKALKHFQTGALKKMAQLPGHFIPQI